MFARLLTVLLPLALLTVPAAHAQPAEPDGKLAAASSAGARAALDRAEGVLAGRLRGDATMALRDLAMSKSRLSGADRAEADRILGRPSDPSDEDSYGANPVTTTCSATVCVHYTTTGSEASTPQLAAAALAEASSVNDIYVAAGYRAPKPDGTDGGSALPDVYLAQIGDRGLYGYCTSEDDVPGAGPYDASAYCVVDNDYAAEEFGVRNTPLENLQVTVAHEYFHAVQFAYDFYEDRWLLEATAAWVEDILYDDVDDNLGYLTYSPLTFPRASMDQTNSATGFHYGIWTFFRFLSERYPTTQAGMPTIVRDIIRRLDGAAGGPDDYSWQGVDRVLRTRGSSGAAAFALFADGNRRPAKTYSEGAANAYPQAPLGAFTFKSGWNVTTIDHLASATARFLPRVRGNKLRLTVDMADKVTSPVAIVSVYLRSGAVSTSAVSLNGAGNGAKTVPFARSKVKAVEVTLVNGSGRFRSCFGYQTPFSCGGAIPVDDNRVAKVSARIVS
jgi:hypothetical protein